MKTFHKLIFGDSRDMRELPDRSIHLVVTSPPYFNAPFDYPDLFESYQQFLELMCRSAREIKRVLDRGRIAALGSKKYPVVADITRV